MARGVIYLGGSGRHLIDSSIDVVADRVARSLRAAIWETGQVEVQLRLQLKRDVQVVAGGIGLDSASIEVRCGESWEQVLEILEVKFLPRFTQRVARLAPIGRALQALLITGKWMARTGPAWLARVIRRGRAPEYSGLDRTQAFMMFIVALATAGSLVYWVFIGLVLWLEFVGLQDIDFGIKGTVGAVLVILASAVHKIHIEPLDQWAIDAFSFTDYQLDDSAYLDVAAAIADAVDFASSRGYTGLDLLGYSLGAILATDAIYPRAQRNPVWAPPRMIDHWVTVGYPFDELRASLPGYFSDRACSRLQVRKWINIVTRHDFMGTYFTPDRPRGIALARSEVVKSPDVNPPPLSNPRLVTPGWRDLIPRRRTINHRYWDDRDPCAPTCFALVAQETGWLEELRSLIRAPQGRPPG